LISDPDRLRAAFLNVLSATAIVAASAFAGIAFVADDFLWLVLGDQWVSAAPRMFWIAIATAFQSYSNTVFMVLNAMGQSRRSAAQTWSRFFILVVVLAFVSQSTDIEGMAASIAYTTIALTPTYLWTLRRVLPFSWWSVFSLSWRPLVASAAMIAWLTLLKSQLLGLSPPVRLLFEVPTGALVFASALWALWLASGKPVGVEHAAILTLGSRLKSLAAVFEPRRR
jgi:O-antigen/teichoic acid export membrane protein